MKRNTVVAENNRSRLTGRDFDLYFFADEEGKLLTAKPEAQAKFYKMVASTNCSFSSNATFETVVDKSTPKAGVKELQTIDWSFQSDNNVADFKDLKSLLIAHKAGAKIYVIMLVATEDMGGSYEMPRVDSEGSIPFDYPEGDCVAFVEGLCVIQSCTLNAQDGSLATFSMTLEGSGDFKA